MMERRSGSRRNCSPWASSSMALEFDILMWDRMASCRRIGNPPGWIRNYLRPIANRRQVTNLPHNYYVPG